MEQEQALHTGYTPSFLYVSVLDPLSFLKFYINNALPAQTSPMLYTLTTIDRHVLMDCYDKVIIEPSSNEEIDERNLRAAEKVMFLFHESLNSPDKNSIQVHQSLLNEILADIRVFRASNIFPEESNAMEEVVTKLLTCA